MDLITKTILRGGRVSEVQHLARNPAFTSLAIKIAKMKQKITK